jgi:hypothetical protein
VQCRRAEYDAVANGFNCRNSATTLRNDGPAEHGPDAQGD